MSKGKKTGDSKVEIWTEEQYEDYLAELYGMEYVAGFTEGGIPYGVLKEDLEVYGENEIDDLRDSDDEVPF